MVNCLFQRHFSALLLCRSTKTLLANQQNTSFLFQLNSGINDLKGIVINLQWHQRFVHREGGARPTNRPLLKQQAAHGSGLILANDFSGISSSSAEAAGRRTSCCAVFWLFIFLFLFSFLEATHTWKFRTDVSQQKRRFKHSFLMLGDKKKRCIFFNIFLWSEPHFIFCLAFMQQNRHTCL